jgi:DisA bacterial checkpoint controller nucleotide-binding/Probable sensor domain DACNK
VTPPFQRDREADRIALLRNELTLAGINVRSYFPSWARKRGVFDSVLRELLVVLEAPVHEGLIPPYGSIVVPKGVDLAPIVRLETKDLPLARKAADGTSALLAFQEDELSGLLLVDPAAAPDLQVAELARHSDGIAFRRERSGVGRVYTVEGGLRYAGRTWARSPALYEAMQTTRRAAPMVDITTLASLLEFAYYVLSPWYIGATLVWLLTDDDPFDGQGTDLRPLQLSVDPAKQAPSLAFAAHLLAQFDGATVVSREGRLLRTGFHLTATQAANEFIPAYEGTRHTSARRASFDLPRTIIVTVSADGPVTIFSDGVSIFQIGWFSADRAAAAYRKTFGRALDDSVWSSGHSAVCGRCGKTSQIEILTIAGWRESEQADCPICGETIAEARCFTIHANIVKAL